MVFELKVSVLQIPFEERPYSKSCLKNDCKFYHVIGMKKSESKPDSTPSTSQEIVSPSNTPNAILTASPPSPISSVFHKVKKPWENEIEKMAEQMEKMMQWQLNQTSAEFDKCPVSFGR